MANSKGNILVAFCSRDGSVEALAKAVAEGAREAGAEVRLRRVPDIVPPAVMAKVQGWEDRSKRMLAEYGAPTQADTEWADGIIFGTPTRFGNTSAELKAVIDSLGSLWFQGKLNGKAAGPLHRREDRTARMRRRCSLFTSRWRIWGSSSYRTATRTPSFPGVRDALRIVLGFRAEQCTADRR